MPCNNLVDAFILSETAVPSRIMQKNLPKAPEVMQDPGQKKKTLLWAMTALGKQPMFLCNATVRSHSSLHCSCQLHADVEGK